MPAHFGTHLHYQCSFELQVAESVIDPWSSVVRIIRQWVSEAPRFSPPPTNPAFFAPWFFTGGEWRSAGQAFHHVKVQRHLGNGSERSPQHWSARYEHACQLPGRNWQIDLGITTLTLHSFQFSLVACHYLRPGYLGKEPPSPQPSSPRVISKIISNQGFRAFAGSEPLQVSPHIIKPGDGEAIRRRINDPRRLCPIVIVSRTFVDDTTLVDPIVLAKHLSGAASVYVCSSSEITKELEWCLGWRFNCWDGMVRVYESGVGLEGAHAPKRHRYFRSSDIHDYGSEAVLEMLVRGIVRRSQPRTAGATATLEDVASFERESRLAELRTTIGANDKSDWITLLEETNMELEGKLRQQHDDNNILKQAAAEADENRRRLEYDKKLLLHRAAVAERSAKIASGRTAAIEGLRKLPSNLANVVSLISSLHAERIAFTDRALRSAADCKSCDVFAAWECLYAMATDLYGIFFDATESNIDIERAFQENTGFRLAMTEGEMTKEDAKLMRERQDVFLGVDIECTPHVKIDKDSMRVYFAPFAHGESKVIVVSYFGHLNTAGTRRRKH